MSNKERYQRVFKALHVSKNMITEVETMKREKHYWLPRPAAVLILCALMVGLLSAAYAADLGGLRQVVNLWVHGRPTEVAITQGEDNVFTVTWEDERGERHETSGGGVALDEDGTERPVTMEEYLDHMRTAANVEQDERGRVMLYYYDQAVDITDAFDDEDNCYIALVHDGKTSYITVHGNPEEDWAIWQSSDGFDEPVLNGED